MNSRRLLAACLAAWLAGCASTPENRGSEESAARKAAEVNTSLGREYLGRGQNEVALEKLKKALNADPGYAPAHTVIAVLYERIGEISSAEKHYRKAVELIPGNGDVNNNYGVFLCSRGRVEESERYFLQAVKDPFYSTPEVAFANAGSCMLQGGQLDKAERYLRQSLEYEKNFPDALLAMASLEFRNSDFLGARAFLQRFEASGTQTAESLWLGWRNESHLNDSRAANQYRNRLLTQFPDSPQAERIRREDAND